MQKTQKWKLKRHLMAHVLKHLPLTIILYLGVVSIMLFPVSIADNPMAWFGGYFGCPVICIFLTRSLVVSLRAANRSLRALEHEGMLDKIVKDFANAEKAMGGNLYIGSLGLYGKGSDHVVLYSQIDRIYSVLSDRRTQHPRDLKYVDRDGTDRFICELDPIGQSNTEIERLYRLVEKKNPAAKTGQ